jgi:taurine dioxygenase
VHDLWRSPFGDTVRRTAPPKVVARLQAALPPVVHPVVLRHPQTGDDVLFVNSEYAVEIVGMTRREGDALLRRVFDHVSHSRDLHVSVTWTPGATILWDNLSMQHARGSEHRGGRRTLRRVLIERLAA